MVRSFFPGLGTRDGPRAGAPGARQQDILDALLERKDGLTAEEIAAAVGVTRSAAHQHLAVLERDGVVERRPRTAGRGRPAHVFVLTEAGLHLFPKRYDWFAELLIARLEAKLGAAGLEGELKALGRSLGERFAGDIGAGTTAERIERVAALMSELGYAARVRPGSETQSGEPELEAFNCVYHHLAARHPEVCALDLALLDALLGVRTIHAECMARGAGCCRFAFVPADDVEAKKA